ncbi:type IV pilus modification protein PilV [Ramlibacter albus]|nr:type IV pilus modification protein PilV [Ramlibacter albus]
MKQRGATLIEILVTIVIVAFGLLGLAGLQMKMQMSETEAYQRSQAIMLLNDMASRIATNRINSASYVSTTTYGTGATCSSISTSTQAGRDLQEWCYALEGAGATLGTAKAGAMINGKGCITSTSGGDILVTVVWQGLTPISAPPSSVTCGATNYDFGTSCVNELCRRFLTTVVKIGTLT